MVTLGTFFACHRAVVEEGRVLRLQDHVLVLVGRDLGEAREGVPAQQRGQRREEHGEGEQDQAGLAAHLGVLPRRVYGCCGDGGQQRLRRGLAGR